MFSKRHPPFCRDRHGDGPQYLQAGDCPVDDAWFAAMASYSAKAVLHGRPADLWARANENFL